MFYSITAINTRIERRMKTIIEKKNEWIRDKKDKNQKPPKKIPEVPYLKIHC